MKWYVTPPPELSGDNNKDIQALHNYVVTLHRELDILVNNNIDEENLTDKLKKKIQLITDTSNKVNKII